MTGTVIAALVIGVIVGAAVMWWAQRAQANGPDTAVPIGEIRNQLAITAGQVQDLAAIFANAQQRGRAGEIVLENLLEATGMARHRDYEAQASANGSRPDVVLNLADRGRLVIDAKFPLDDYRRAAAAADPSARQQALAAHAKAVLRHVAGLAERDYPSKVAAAIDFTVCFVPADDLLATACEQDPGLLEKALAKRVLLATPVTVAALLWGVAWGWQRDARVNSAEKVGELGAELHKRLGTMADRADNLRRKLNGAVETYNEMVGSLEGRVLPQARRFEDLGILPPGQRLPELEELTAHARAVSREKYPAATPSLDTGDQPAGPGPG
jgi:DNA recombination protein RmuC